MLIALIVEAHGNQRTALGKHAFRQIGRALRDQPQRHAVLATFLGDPLEDLAHALSGIDGAGGDVAMRFLADEQDRLLLLVTRPDGEIEDQPRHHGDHDMGDLRGHGRGIDDGDRLALRRQAEDLGEEVLHRIRDQHA